MPRPVIEFLITEAHRNHLRVVAHTHALLDFKHLLRSEIDAFAHPTWRQTDVEPVDDELIALFKAHPNVPVMTSMWTPRHEIYGARPYWIDDPLLGETFTKAEIVARVYADVDHSLWPFAEWSVRAQLDYLAATGDLPPGVEL
jgi:hypothetical protein